MPGKAEATRPSKDLVPIVYSELRRLARHQLRHERPDHTLQPTALTNEAFVRLFGYRQVGWQYRAHFFAIAAKVMRRILVDHARKRQAAKRGADAARVTLDEAHTGVEPDWSALPASTPPKVRDVLRRCLRKETFSRLRDIGDARIEIDEALNEPVETEDPSTKRSSAFALVALTLVAVVALGLLFWSLTRSSPTSDRVTRVVVPLDPANILARDIVLPAVTISPDGRHVAYMAGERSHMYLRSMDEQQGELVTGTEDAGAPFFSLDSQWVGFYSRADGTTLMFQEQHRETDWDLWVLSTEGTTRAFLRTQFRERLPEFSPDGRFIAYESDESGQFEIYVRTFPSADTKWQVSTGGGRNAKWSADGRELFYRNGDQLLAVDTDLSGELVLGQPELVFERRTAIIDYDVSPDSQHFVMVDADEKAHALPTQLNLVLNWSRELERLP